MKILVEMRLLADFEDAMKGALGALKGARDLMQSIAESDIGQQRDWHQVDRLNERIKQMQQALTKYNKITGETTNAGNSTEGLQSNNDTTQQPRA